MRVLRLERHSESNEQTLGSIYEGMHELFRTLELPYMNNRPNISCIPKGKYLVKPRVSPKYGRHYIVTDVEGRKLILIHSGNFFWNTRGCILLGLDLYDINNDGQLDVTDSRKAMKRFRKLIGWNKFTLYVK